MLKMTYQKEVMAKKSSLGSKQTTTAVSIEVNTSKTIKQASKRTPLKCDEVTKKKMVPNDVNMNKHSKWSWLTVHGKVEQVYGDSFSDTKSHQKSSIEWHDEEFTRQDRVTLNGLCSNAGIRSVTRYVRVLARYSKGPLFRQLIICLG